MLSIFYSINIDVDPTEDGDAKDLDLFDIHLLAHRSHSLPSITGLFGCCTSHALKNELLGLLPETSNFFTIQFNQVITAQAIIVDT